MTVHFKTRIDGPPLRGMPIVEAPPTGARVGIVNVDEMSCCWEPHILAGGPHTLAETCDLKTMTIDVTRREFAPGI